MVVNIDRIVNLAKLEDWFDREIDTEESLSYLKNHGELTIRIPEIYNDKKLLDVIIDKYEQENRRYSFRGCPMESDLNKYNSIKVIKK